MDTSNLTMVDCIDGSSNLFIQIMGTVVFVAVWPFVVLDMKWFPLGRPAAALVGGAAMVILHVASQADVYDIQGELGNMQTIFLLVGMMMLSYYYDREGLLRLISLWMFGDHKPFKTILWKMCLLSAIFSAFITNDATCLVITPLLLNEALKQGRDRRELLPMCMAIATCANIGSASTIFGNPQNAFIAASAGVSLLEFFIALLPASIYGTVCGIIGLYLFYWKIVFGRMKPLDAENAETESIRDGNAPRQYTIPRTLAEERESLALSYDQSQDPYMSSQIAKERGHLYGTGGEHSQTTSYTRLPGSRGRSSHGRGASPHPSRQGGHLKVPSPSVPEIRVEDEAQRRENGVRKDYGGREDSHSIALDDTGDDDVVQVKTFKERSWCERIFAFWLVFVTFLVVILLAIPPPPTVNAEFNLGLVPVGAAILTMLADTILLRKYAYDAMLKIDWTVILMFMGLFVWLGGFQNTCFPTIAFYKMAPYMNLNTVGGILLFSVFVIIGSNLFSNVPLVILIVERIDDLCGEEQCSGPLPGLLLAWVSTIAGNFTLLGSVANLIVAEKARSTAEYRLTFWTYLRYGFLSTMFILFTALPIVYFLGKLA